MRKFFLGCVGVAFSGLVACSDLPTAPTSSQPDARLSGLMGCPRGPDGENCYTLPPVSGGPTIPACDPWMDANWCKGDQCVMGVPAVNGPEFSGIASCPIGGWPIGGPGQPGGPGGDGGSPPPAKPPLEQPDTACNTPTDQIVTSSAIQSAFSTIWQQSNYGLPHPQRREQGGWITSDGFGGLQFTPFPSSWAREPCRIGFPAQVTPPPNVVAWVHTHPYRNGELLTECQQQQLPNGARVPFTYRGDPSWDDDDITRSLRQAGYAHVRGYIIDEDKITWFTGDDTPTSVGSYSRCGY
jgi:hypothetical protein